MGNFGDVGVYSASTTKTLDTYGGGICVTNREDVFAALEKYEKHFTIHLGRFLKQYWLILSEILQQIIWFLL